MTPSEVFRTPAGSYAADQHARANMRALEAQSRLDEAEVLLRLIFFSSALDKLPAKLAAEIDRFLSPNKPPKRVEHFTHPWAEV